MNITIELDGKKYAGVLAEVDETAVAEVAPEVPATTDVPVEDAPAAADGAPEAPTQ